jgi:ribonuclease P protein component
MKNQEISTLIGQKRAYNSSSFLLRLDNNLLKNPKNIAILASKKNFKTAVLRNKVRRRIKNAINRVILEKDQLNINQTKHETKHQINEYFLVFSPKKGFETVNFADLVEEIKQSLVKNGII